MPSLNWVYVSLLAGLVLLTAGAIFHSMPVSLSGAAIFATGILASALSASTTLRYADASSATYLKHNAALDVARHHTLLAALAYAWAACGFASVYLLSDFVWYHAYQYGFGAFVGSCSLYGLYRRMGAAETAAPPPVAATALHMLAAGGGLGYLAGTGKIMSLRSDWPGNVIFVSGGITIVLLCAIAIRAQLELRSKEI
jgi:hypothetical protein